MAARLFSAEGQPIQVTELSIVQLFVSSALQTETSQVVKTQTISQEIGLSLQKESNRDTNS